MKTFLYVLVAVISVSIIACTGAIDIQQEEAAIRAVIEAEKDAYFEQDFGAISEVWAQKPTSVKMIMTESEKTEYVGWEQISAGDQEGLAQVPSEMTLSFSDYVFHVYNNSAWVTCKANWDGRYNDQPTHWEQQRVLAFEKAGGEWKYTLMAIYNIPQVDVEAEKAVIRAVLNDMEKASETNDPELISNIFSHSPDNIFFGTDATERWVGFNSLIDAMTQFYGSLEKGSEMTMHDVVSVIHASGDVAWVSSLMDWKGKSQGESFSYEGLRFTAVLEKQNGEWVIVQMHSSVPVSGQAMKY